MRVEFATIDGVETRCFRAGSEGPALLLIHGAGVSGASWLRNVDALGRHFRVCAPDTLGHGLTQPGDETQGPPHPAMIDHLAGLVDHLGWHTFFVAGSSFGALLAALLYLRMPERVTRLITVSSGSFVNTDEELASSLNEAYANGLSAIAEPTLENCRRRMERIFFDPAAVPPELIFMQMTEYAVPWARAAFERRLRGMMDIEACRPYRVLERLEEIALPTLLLWGHNDTRGHFARARQARDRLPNAKLIAFVRCKHHPHIEHADKFNALAIRFLSGESLADHAEII